VNQVAVLAVPHVGSYPLEWELAVRSLPEKLASTPSPTRLVAYNDVPMTTTEPGLRTGSRS
jgi:hypothetical protein